MCKTFYLYTRRATAKQFFVAAFYAKLTTAFAVGPWSSTPADPRPCSAGTAPLVKLWQKHLSDFMQIFVYFLPCFRSGEHYGYMSTPATLKATTTLSVANNKKYLWGCSTVATTIASRKLKTSANCCCRSTVCVEGHVGPEEYLYIPFMKVDVCKDNFNSALKISVIGES